MPVYQKLIDADLIISQLSVPPIIINDLSDISTSDRSYVDSLITTNYTGDMVSMMPSCKCGAEKGEYSIGIICSTCNTPVQSSLEGDIEPLVWFRKPIGVAKLLNPVVLTMLKNRFKKSGFSIIQWLMDTTYKPTVKQPIVIDKLVQSGIKRGYNNFVEHFDSIMEYLFTFKEFDSKKEKVDYLQELIAENRNILFSDYLPLPNRSLLIVENTNLGIYVDETVMDGIDAIKMLVAIDAGFYDQSSKVKENRTAKALVKLSDFYEQYTKTSVAGKPGQFRRHVFGSRTAFSFRCVISSLTDTHNYREIEAPWWVGVTAFRPHLINKMLKLGMDLNSSIGLLLSHVEKYHPLIGSLLDEIIAESPRGEGIVITTLRNPSLLKSSILKMRIGKFKKDAKDLTASIPILVVKQLNATI